jgi:hypothetical protein
MVGANGNCDIGNDSDTRRLTVGYVIDLAVTYGMLAYPSSVCLLVLNRQRHAKMPSTPDVPAMCQSFMTQRARFWEGKLQRLSGRSEAHAKVARMGGRAGRCDVRRRRAPNRPRGAKHPLPEPGTRIKKKSIAKGQAGGLGTRWLRPDPPIKKEYKR